MLGAMPRPKHRRLVAPRRASRRRSAASRRSAPPGRLLLFTGDGKGKTTAALGTMLRAWGRGMRVACVQFVKPAGAAFGEHRAGKRLGWEVEALGAGLVRDPKRAPEHRAAARRAWARARARLADPKVDLLVLDEITLPIRWGWIGVSGVLAALRTRPEGMHVICTGRGAPAALAAAADTVTEMRCRRHAFDRGVPALPGIEF